MRRIIAVLTALAALSLPAVAGADIVDDNPAVTSLAPGRLDVAARAADGTIVTRHLDTASGAWSPWVAVPGLAATSGPALVADDDGLHLAARGPDDATFVASSPDGGVWSAWTSLGGRSITGPGLDNRTGTTELDAMVTGTNGNLCHTYRPSPAEAWSAFGCLAASSTSAPGLVSRGPHLLDAFYRNGADGAVARYAWDGSAWTVTNLGGQIVGAITAITRAPNQMDIYARGIYGPLFARAFDGTNWGDFVQFTQNAGTSAPAAATTGGGRVDMVTRDATHLYHRYYDGTGADYGWHEFADVGTIEVPPPPVDRGAPNGTGAADGATVSIGFAGSAKTRRTYRYGRAFTVGGVLTGPSGPISGATLDVLVTPAASGARQRLLRTVTTGPDGAWSTGLTAGPSRRIIVTYRAFANDANVVASPELSARSTTRLTFKASRKRAHRGDRVRFTGRLLGRPIPKGGKLLALQAYESGKWRTFEQVRTHAKGRFHASYRFRTSPPRRRVLRFRVRASREAAYPYETTASRTRRLTLLPG